MIDEQKIIGMLQAKALGCLDPTEETDLQNYINDGHIFPWEELGLYQHAASLLPMALELEIPDPELKDRVALRLIKLSDELRIKKMSEEEKLEVDEDVEEFVKVETPYFNPLIEIEPDVVEVQDDLDTNISQDEATFNLDEIYLPGFEPVKVSEPQTTGFTEVEVPVENVDEQTTIEMPQVEEINVEEAFADADVESFTPPTENETVPDIAVEPKQVTEPEDPNKQMDLTKKSVAEKMFKAIEQDFDSLKYQFDESEKKLTRGLLISYVIIAVLLALLIFSFFKFSTDIKSLENEVKSLKKNLSSQLFINDRTNRDPYSFS
jgi:hypothetical protein